jgi:hypothetical protein
MRSALRQPLPTVAVILAVGGDTCGHAHAACATACTHTRGGCAPINVGDSWRGSGKGLQTPGLAVSVALRVQAPSKKRAIGGGRRVHWAEALQVKAYCVDQCPCSVRNADEHEQPLAGPAVDEGAATPQLLGDMAAVRVAAIAAARLERQGPGGLGELRACQQQCVTLRPGRKRARLSKLKLTMHECATA